MNNQNKIMLDGMEKIEVNPLDQPVYLPSKSKMTTQRDEVQATRDPMTIEYFKGNFPEPTPIAGPFTRCIDVSSMYAMNYPLLEFTPVRHVVMPIWPNSVLGFADMLKHFNSFEGSSIDKLDYDHSALDYSLLSMIEEMEELQADLNCPLCSIEAFAKGPEKVSTGIDEFDQLLGGGFTRGGLTVIGSQTGVGRTRLLMELGTNLCHTGTKFVVSVAEQSHMSVIEEFLDSDELGGFEVLDNDMSLKSLITSLREVLDGIWAEVNEVPIVLIDDAMFYKDNGAHTLATQLRDIAKEYNVAVVLTNPLSRQAHYDNAGLWLSGDTYLITAADAALTMVSTDATGWNKITTVKNRNIEALGQYTFFDPISRAFSPF